MITEAHVMTSDAAISATFEQILDQLDRERRLSDPKDKTEQAYWRSQHHAFAKAAAHFAEGVRPKWTGLSYLVRSATRPDAVVHRVRRVGDIWLCSCEATHYCWHAAMTAAYDQSEDNVELTAETAMDEIFGVAV